MPVEVSAAYHLDAKWHGSIRAYGLAAARIVHDNPALILLLSHDYRLCGWL